MPASPRPAPVLPAGDISPRQHKTRIVHDLLTPMRDGVQLALDLIRPDVDPGLALPVVLVRTPYNKVMARTPFLEELAERGYIVAIQDTRGRDNSDGDFFPYRDDRADGFDTVEWINEQPWCDGNIGMHGGSYVGQTQWFAAADAPKGLKAIVPIVSPPDAFFNEPICNGCFLLPMGEWMTTMGRRSYSAPPPTFGFAAMKEYFNALPISTLPEKAGNDYGWWHEMMQHPNLDDFWRSCSYQDAWPNITVPALNITGWWDMNFPGSWMNYEGMRTQGKTEEIRDRQRLLIGPWPHQGNRERALNGVDFGDEAIVNLDDHIVRWFDHWLKGIDNGVEADPRVRVFVLGVNEWRTYADWPLPEATPTPFYFHSNGRANTLLGDGVLSTDAPEAEPADTYDYDPADPVVAVWKIADGPVDDRVQSTRHDVLCYTSAPLTEPVEAIGRASVVLYASSSARDTDWHVRLCDVHPDGSARFLAHGMLRARFRESFEEPKFLEPGEIYRYEFGLDAVGIRFLPGHCIRVEVTSSWFPEYDRNTNSGAANNFTDDQFVVASQRIHHDGDHASHIVLPVVKIATNGGE